MKPGRQLLDALAAPALLAGLSPMAWTALVRHARREDMLAILAERVAEAGCAATLPASARVLLDEARAFADHNHRVMRREVERIGRDLEGLAVPLVLLKGCAYLALAHPASVGRGAGDVDLLVPRSWLGAVEARLAERGWRFDKTDAYDQHYYRAWMHELPNLSHPQRPANIDLHHTILPLTSRLKPKADALVRDAVATPLAPFAALSATDRILHSAAHLFHDDDFDRGLRNLWDLHRLIAADIASARDWGGLLARARYHDMLRPLGYALLTLERLTGLAMPADVRNAVGLALPPAPVAAVMAWAIDTMLAGPDPQATTLQRWLAGRLLYIRSHWLRMPPLMLATHLGRKALRRLQPARA